MNLTPILGAAGLQHRPDFVPIQPLSHVAALPPPVRGNQTKHDGAGLPTLVIYARFVAWAIEQSRFPMPEQVCGRFNCSRATAHRWLNALEEAYGVDRPRRPGGGPRREVAE